jgi:hypothetical protein
MSEITAKVLYREGQAVLVDPVGFAVVQAVERHNCRLLLEANAERVQHFVGRVAALGRSSSDTVIVLLDVDDPAGSALADVLMPGHDWQAIRDQGMKPIARGLAGREGIQEALDSIDSEAGKVLSSMEALAVVVVANGVGAVFSAQP